MKLIQKEQCSKNMLDKMFNKNCEYWDLGNEFIAEVGSFDNDDEFMISIYVYNTNNIHTVSPAERWIKDDKFAHELQKNIQTIKIGYGIDVAYISCPKNQLASVLTEIERYINNQHQ